MMTNLDDVKRILAELAALLEQSQGHREQLAIRHAMRLLERFVPPEQRQASR